MIKLTETLDRIGPRVLITAGVAVFAVPFVALFAVAANRIDWGLVAEAGLIIGCALALTAVSVGLIEAGIARRSNAKRAAQENARTEAAR